MGDDVGSGSLGVTRANDEDEEYKLRSMKCNS